MPYTQLGDLQTMTLADSASCDNACCILTLDNIVLLMGNMELDGYVGGTALATVPESMRPIETVVRPVCLGDDVVLLTISTDGELTLKADHESGTLYLNGFTFTPSDRYYNRTIGNNFSQGTSPLRWDYEEQA